jgi:hypothetical protein
MTRDLIGLADLDPDTIRRFLVDAREMASRPPMWRGPLDDRLIALVFLEESTRTRVSFEIAAMRLGARTVELSGRGSSVAKGESLADTVRTIEALGVDAIVLRARQDGAAEEAARALGCPLINAGAGTQEHPTQGLLDAYVLAEAHGRLDTFDLSGLTLGFAAFNKHPAQIFLGDAGSLPIGLCLAFMLIVVAETNLAAALLLSLYTLADASVTLVRRLAAGEPIASAHRTHFYQRAVAQGLSVPQVTARVFLLCDLLAILAVVTVLARSLAVDLLCVGLGVLATGLTLYALARGR